MLMIEFHGTEASVAEQARRFGEIAAGHGAGPFASATKPEERSRLWQARHDTYWAQMTLRPGADRRTVPTPAFALGAPPPTPHPPTSLAARIADSIRGAITQVEALNQVSIGALRKVLAGLLGSHLEGSLPFAAQHAPTNAPLKIGRRFATLSLPLEEMHEVESHFGATLNDVAVTVVDGGLHAYLRESGHA